MAKLLSFKINDMWISYQSRDELELILLYLDVFDVSWFDGQKPFDYKPKVTKGTIRVHENMITYSRSVVEKSKEKLVFDCDAFIKLMDDYDRN